MKRALAVSVLAIPVLAFAQAKEQFVPVNSYWVGPYAPGGSGIAAGMIDYFKLLNTRDNGINGVKVTWEKCETEYRNDRGVECYERSKKKGPTGATLIHPLNVPEADRIYVMANQYPRVEAARVSLACAPPDYDDRSLARTVWRRSERRRTRHSPVGPRADDRRNPATWLHVRRYRRPLLHSPRVHRSSAE